MDILVLIGSFTVICLLGVPMAYALGISPPSSAPSTSTSRSRR